MKVLGIILCILYAGFMIFAVCKERLKSTSSLWIATGGLLTGIYAVSRITGEQNLILLLIAGMISISVGTLLNGLKQAHFHIHHHIIRLLMEIGITAVCWIGK